MPRPSAKQKSRTMLPITNHWGSPTPVRPSSPAIHTDRPWLYDSARGRHLQVLVVRVCKSFRIVGALPRTRLRPATCVDTGVSSSTVIAWFSSSVL
jgi:hypothetical protein